MVILWELDISYKLTIEYTWCFSMQRYWQRCPSSILYDSHSHLSKKWWKRCFCQEIIVSSFRMTTCTFLAVIHDVWRLLSANQWQLTFADCNTWIILERQPTQNIKIYSNLRWCANFIQKYFCFCVFSLSFLTQESEIAGLNYTWIDVYIDDLLEPF